MYIPYWQVLYRWKMDIENISISLINKSCWPDTGFLLLSQYMLNFRIWDFIIEFDDEIICSVWNNIRLRILFKFWNNWGEYFDKKQKTGHDSSGYVDSADFCAVSADNHVLYKFYKWCDRGVFHGELRKILFKYDVS